MNKTILTIIVIIFVATIGYWYWRETEPAAPVENMTEETTEPADLTCHQNDSYFVVVRPRTDAVGEDILVKTKSEGSSLDCAYEIAAGDREFTEAEANYFFGLSDDYLFIDQGTAPPPRRIIVVDLQTKEEVYTDLYNRPAAIEASTFTYWKPIDDKPTVESCPDLPAWEADGLGAGLEERVSLDLDTLALTEEGEVRCSARQ